MKIPDHRASKSITWLACCFLLNLGISASGQPRVHTNWQQLLYGCGYGSSSNFHDFWMDSSLLPGKVSWQPGKEPFPLALDAEVTRARSFLIQEKQITNHVGLDTVDIKQAHVRLLAPSDRGQAPRLVTNAWFVALGFQEQRHEPTFSDGLWVVMLLDGTYASEKIRAKARMEQQTNSSATITPSLRGASAPTRPRRASPKKENPYELPTRPDFRVPEIQWVPDAPFPLDLSDLVARNHDSLVLTNQMPEEYKLRDISICRYDPVGAVPDDTTRLQQHGNHWLIVCSYAQDGIFDLYQEYRAYTLLDGRTLSLTMPDP